MQVIKTGIPDNYLYHSRECDPMLTEKHFLLRVYVALQDCLLTCPNHIPPKRKILTALPSLSWIVLHNNLSLSTHLSKKKVSWLFVLGKACLTKNETLILLSDYLTNKIKGIGK